jgi:hypothetical protein
MTFRVLHQGAPVFRASCLALLGLTTFAAGTTAQVAREPQLILSIGGGIAAGRGELWGVPRQPLGVAGSSSQDTVGVARRLRPGLTATLAATYHRSGRLGYTAEAGYFGVATEMRCTPPANGYVADTEQKNEQACANAQGSHMPTSLVGFQGGLAYKLRDTGRILPYVRASAGIGFLANPFVRTEAIITAPSTCPTSSGQCWWRLLDDDKDYSLTWVSTIAAGTSIIVAPGYRFRFEARDLITSLPTASGSGDPVSRVAPVGSTVKHVLVFTAGMDVVLERRRGRRY